MAIERATNQSAAKLVEEKIWQPLSPEQDAVVVVDSSGFPYFGAGMNACARDLARFGEMLGLNGRYNGRQIVPEKWVEDTARGNEEAKELFAACHQVWVGKLRGSCVLHHLRESGYRCGGGQTVHSPGFG